ncbi:MAG: sporulation protein YabP [Ruminococcaceae bacterium]|nr:sporulation protein YabP [Oscillospiraceae bacterium]
MQRSTDMNTENKQFESKLHTLSINNRQGARIEGVLEVIRFDENEVLLETVCGTLSIDGEGLSLSEWNTERGLASLDGRIDAVTYFDKKQEDSKSHGRLFGKFLK